jgi:hypothetical protein
MGPFSQDFTGDLVDVGAARPVPTRDVHPTDFDTTGKPK